MNIEITDEVTPMLRQLENQLSDPTDLHDEIGTAVEKLVTDNLLPKTRQRNRLGATSTGFWGRVRDSVHSTADAAGVTIRIPERGAALHYYGGPVRAKNKPWLTIPISARSHGKTVADLGTKLYRFTSKKGNQLLAEDPTGGRRGGKSGQPRKARSGPVRYRGGEVLYLLRKSVEIRADKSVLPEQGAIVATVGRQASRYLARLTQGGAA